MPHLLAYILVILVLAIGESLPNPEEPSLFHALFYLGVMPVVCIGTGVMAALFARRLLGTETGSQQALQWLARGQRLVLAFATLLLMLALWNGQWLIWMESWIPPQLPLVTRPMVLIPYLASLLAGIYPIVRVQQRFLGRPRGAAALLGELRPLLLVLIPYLLFTGILDLGYYFPELEERLATDPWMSCAALILVLATLLTFSPLVVRLLWPSRPLPEGPFRDRLRSLAESAGVTCREIRVWDTGGRGVINACITGAFRPLRTVFFTDAMLSCLEQEQLEGVFAHELGHARQHHFLIYFTLVVAFLLLMLTVEKQLASADGLTHMAIVLGGLLLFWVFFGVLSRHLESQADLFGAQLIGSCMSYAGTLKRIGELTGTLDRRRGWRHPPIPQRIELLLRSSSDPVILRSFQRRTRRLLVMVLILLLGSSGAFAQAVAADGKQPLYLKDIELAEYLKGTYQERSLRPGGDSRAQRELLERADQLLYRAQQSMSGDRELASGIQEIYYQRAALHEALGNLLKAAALRARGDEIILEK